MPFLLATGPQLQRQDSNLHVSRLTAGCLPIWLRWNDTGPMKATKGALVHYVAKDGVHHDAYVTNIHDDWIVDLQLLVAGHVHNNVEFQEEGQYETWHWPGSCGC